MTVTVKPAEPELDEPLDRFALWAFEALDVPVANRADSSFQATLPPRLQSAFGREQLTFRFGDTGSGTSDETLTADSPLLQRLVSALLAGAPVVHATPRNEPAGVHQITAALFAAYTVQDGHVRLQGCGLESRPILRITLRRSADRLVHLFVDEKGQPVSDQLRQDLGLDDLTVLTRPPVRVADQKLDQWQKVGRQAASDRNSDASPLLVTVVWCKYATGSLLFSIGRQSTEIDFAGWASRLAAEIEKPPPYTCPLSNQSSYHLALTDDQHLTVAEAIGTCSESGRRVLQSALETCQATEQAALPEHMRDCPVSGQRVAASALQPCEMCREQVSPTALRRGRCTACRQLESVAKHEPRVVRLLGEYPGLDHWRRWKISETATVYVTVATSLLRRLLLVAEKQSLEVRRIATGTLPFSNWQDSEPLQRDELLGTRS